MHKNSCKKTDIGLQFFRKTMCILHKSKGSSKRGFRSKCIGIRPILFPCICCGSSKNAAGAGMSQRWRKNEALFLPHTSWLVAESMRDSSRQNCTARSLPVLQPGSLPATADSQPLRLCADKAELQPGLWASPLPHNIFSGNCETGAKPCQNLLTEEGSVFPRIPVFRKRLSQSYTKGVTKL